MTVACLKLDLKIRNNDKQYRYRPLKSDEEPL